MPGEIGSRTKIRTLSCAVAYGLLIVVLAAPGLSFASEPYDYMSDVIGGLGKCQLAFEALKPAESEDFPTAARELMEHGLVAAGHFRIANLLIGKYRDSSNERIRTSAEALSSFYTEMEDNYRQFVLLLEQDLNDPGDTELKPGTLLRKLTEFKLRADSAWKALPAVIFLAFSTLVDRERKTPHNFLTITQAELDQLRLQLSAFDDKTQSDNKPGQSNCAVSAVWLRGTLANKWIPIAAP